MRNCVTIRNLVTYIKTMNKSFERWVTNDGKWKIEITNHRDEVLVVKIFYAFAHRWRWLAFQESCYFGLLILLSWLRLCFCSNTWQINLMLLQQMFVQVSSWWTTIDANCLATFLAVCYTICNSIIAPYRTSRSSGKSWWDYNKLCIQYKDR